MVDEADQRVMIAVDGGAKLENAASLVEAGADIIIMGTALFQSEDMAGTIRSIRGSTAASPHR
jgi:ribulose-phosphate 3-epimerase